MCSSVRLQTLALSPTMSSSAAAAAAASVPAGSVFVKRAGDVDAVFAKVPTTAT